jgi:PKHD-type hydroxylase
MWHLKEPDINPLSMYKDNLFTHDECSKLIELGHTLGMIKDTNYFQHSTKAVGDTGVLGHENLRKSSTIVLSDKDEENYWIWQRCTEMIHGFNQSFGFDLTYIESLQISCYDSSKDYYHKHHDMLFKSFQTRKLTFSIQLSDSSDYIGGDLELYHEKDPVVMSRQQGTVNIFPSFVPHGVTPVTSGKRYCLLGWVCGPKFK